MVKIRHRALPSFAIEGFLFEPKDGVDGSPGGIEGLAAGDQHLAQGRAGNIRYIIEPTAGAAGDMAVDLAQMDFRRRRRGARAAAVSDREM